MSRLFLAFVALLSGLCAQLAPAQGRERAIDASEVGALLVEADAEQHDVATEAAIVPGCGQGAEIGERPRVRQRRTVYIPTVMLKADRAHE